MLFVLNKNFRIKAALAVALLYAVCILAPHAAMALGSAGAAHCLTDSSTLAHVHKSKASSSPHARANGETHHHGSASHHHDDGNQSSNEDGKSKDHSGTCCGLFCVTAITANDAIFLAPNLSLSTNLQCTGDSLAGRGPGRLNRPPIG